MTITYRNTKGTALTYDEMDENIRDLCQDTTIDRVLGNGNTTTKNITVGSINATAISINNQGFAIGYTGSQGYTGSKGDIGYTGSVSAFTGTLTTNWAVRESSGTLIFSYSGVDKMKIDSSGNLTVVGNVTGYGTI
jgi:hypothetical protein